MLMGSVSTGRSNTSIPTDFCALMARERGIAVTKSVKGSIKRASP
jgi:hypothetical protein